jgi:hypothetical protein
VIDMAMVLDWMVVDLIALYAAIIFDRHQKRKLSEEAFFFNLKIWLISRGVKDV